MITREQAEQTFRAYAERMKPTYEIRDFQLERMIDTSDINREDLEDELYLDLEEEGWRCTYERNRYDFDKWFTAICYIVEPKPEPFVIE